MIVLLCLTTSSAAAANCKPIDRDATINQILSSNPGSKVLKVAEHTDNDGCEILKIRILVDGTVKAITVDAKGA